MLLLLSTATPVAATQSLCVGHDEELAGWVLKLAVKHPVTDHVK
jgi:hypothetical protein